MSEELNHIELFDRYLCHEMNKKEMADFELRLKTDSVFSSEFEFHLQIHKGIEALGDDLIKTELNTLHNNYLSKQQTKASFIRKVVYISGGLFFFLLMLILVLLNPEKTAEERNKKTKAKVTSYKDSLNSIPIQSSPIQPTKNTLNKNKEEPKLSTPDFKRKSISKRANIVIREYHLLPPVYLLQDNMLFINGLALDTNANIVLDQNKLYLINKNRAYLIDEFHSFNALEETKNKFYDSNIHTQNPKKIRVRNRIFTQPVFMDTLTLITKKSTNKLSYDFDGKTLAIHPALYNDFTKATFIHSDTKFIINTDLTDYIFEINDSLNLLKENKTYELPNPQIVEFDINLYDNTLEKKVNWENSN